MLVLFHNMFFILTLFQNLPPHTFHTFHINVKLGI
jgi:hypothetical protein